MARADLLLQLVEAALAANDVRIRHVVEALIADEHGKRHTVLASDLAKLLSKPTRSRAVPMGSATPSSKSAYREVEPKLRLGDLQLPDAVRIELSAVVEENHRAELLRAYGLEPRHRVLLVGPPGNGKTSCAEALAGELSVPLIVLRYEQIITSFLGETSSNLGAMLADVRQRHCVLLIDEFDALAKERGDEHDAGEMKRIVSTLLLQLDDLPSHVLLCAATNHSELLDRAVWRRFDTRLTLPAPDETQRAAFINRVCDRFGLKLGRSSKAVAQELGQVSYSEVEDFLVNVRRRQLLNGDVAGQDPRILAQQLELWRARAGQLTNRWSDA